MTSARRILRAFYAAVLLIALAGQVGAAVGWLHLPLLVAIPAAIIAAGAVELGGVALSVHADARRQLGEHAIPARLLSAAVAGGAVVVNWLGHTSHLQGGFFAGMSALGYTVWLIDSAARRRDRLRAARMLPPTAPAYPLWQWLRHPMLTARARTLALVDPGLGLYRSLDEARAAVRRERQHTTITKVLHRKLRAGLDPTSADLAIATYDLDQIAVRLADGADYDGLAALLAADLQPAAVVGAEASPAPAVDTTPDIPDVDGTPPASTDMAGGTAAELRMSTPDAMLAAQSLYLANTDMPIDTIARIVGRSERTVRRYLVPVGGAPVPVSGVPAGPGEAPAQAWNDLPRPMTLDEELAALVSISDPRDRARAAELALFGAASETTSPNGEA